MPTDTLDADSVCFATTSALTNEPIANMNVGYYIGTTYASAIRFVLPSLTSINSATLKVYNATNSGGGALVTALSVKASEQSLPTGPIGSGWTPFGSEVSITSPTAEIDVTALLQAALTAEVLDAAVCFIWLDDGSDDGLLQFDGIDPSLDPFNFPPQLEIDYDVPTGETIECESATFILTGNDASLVTGPKIVGDRGTFALTGRDAAFKSGRRIAAESGAFALSGNPFDEVYARAIVAESGQFALAGKAGLLVGPGVTLQGDVGEFDLAGGDVEFVDGNAFGCEPGSFGLAGGDANLSLVTPAAEGEFAITGNDVAFVIQPYVDAQKGAFALVGRNAVFVKSQISAAKHMYYHFLVRS